MRSMQLRLFTATLACLVFLSCKKETEEFKSDPLSDYFPLQTGKYIIYSLDSTVFTNFGTITEVHSYQEKHSIDEKITDAAGRETYRVFRFIRDAAGTQPWRPAGSYFVTPLDKQIEVVENNLRFVKLHLPLRKDFTWKGNMYLGQHPFGSSYNFSDDEYMKDWDYRYVNLDDTLQYGQQKISGVVQVLHFEQRNKLDTVEVSANQAFIPQDSESAWLKGSASDTIIINTIAPTPTHDEYLTVYNRTNAYASLNNILIPPGNSLQFQFYNDKWYYPNPIFVSNNVAKLEPWTSVTYLFGIATDTIKVDTKLIDTSRVKSIKIYNKSNFDAVCKFNAATSAVTITPGFGRSYELYNREWRIVGDASTLLDKDPYSSDLPFGSSTYSVEKYAKGIGMVYQEFLMWEYQPPNASNPSGYRNGFGVKRSIIDHN